MIAWRNLWRQRRRTLITSSSIAFAILLSTIMTGIGDATYGEMIDLERQVDLGNWDRLWGATQINDAGIVAGHGRYDVEQRGFLMVPNGP